MTEFDIYCNDKNYLKKCKDLYNFLDKHKIKKINNLSMFAIFSELYDFYGTASLCQFDLFGIPNYDLEIRDIQIYSLSNLACGESLDMFYFDSDESMEEIKKYYSVLNIFPVEEKEIINNIDDLMACCDHVSEKDKIDKQFTAIPFGRFEEDKRLSLFTYDGLTILIAGILFYDEIISRLEVILIENSSFIKF